ncbi:protein fuzzy homolog isoform X1 [Procambarus clarkii]|uniref:protein fuzzy homolog isoform X1 n=1 Tax=Procambarus clarkii TaxID=6728 RepID=UPI0037420EFB
MWHQCPPGKQHGVVYSGRAVRYQWSTSVRATHGPWQASYALIGSLNGIHVFGESHGVTLCTTRTQNANLIWKTYHDSIRLVLIRGSETIGDSCDGSLLDLMFASLVLLLGLDTLTSATNVERLKRDIRPCYALLDELLSRAMGCEDQHGFSHLTGCAECLIPSEQHNLQSELEKFAEGADSTYGCVIMQGHVLCGTRNFWSLSHAELVLLPLLVASNASTVARDLPIYLPNKSPNVPFRMLVVQLTGHISVVTLCGPTPTLSEMMRAASSFWAPSYQVLEALTSLLPWNISPSLLSQLDNAIIGLILVNYDQKKCVSCVHLSEESRSRCLSVNRKVAALRSVYRTVVGPLLQPPAMPPDDFPSRLHPDHTPVEAYVSTDNYKVYVLQSSPYHLLVLFPPALPVHIARQVSIRTLAVFTKGKVPKI